MSLQISTISTATMPQSQLQTKVHPIEAQLIALEGSVQSRVQCNVLNTAQAKALADELANLRKDMVALRQEHGGCVSAVAGEMCEHCVSVVKLRLYKLLERERYSRISP
jgi:hypothetical protein